MDAANAIDDLGYAQVRYDTGKRKRIGAGNVVFLLNQRHHIVEGEISGFLQVFVDAER